MTLLFTIHVDHYHSIYNNTFLSCFISFLFFAVFLTIFLSIHYDSIDKHRERTIRMLIETYMRHILQIFQFTVKSLIEIKQLKLQADSPLNAPGCMQLNARTSLRATELTLNRAEIASGQRRLRLMTIFFGGRKENPFMPSATTHTCICD